SIPASRIVSVVPSAIGTGGTPLAMTTVLIAPQTGPRAVGVREFGSAAEVGQYFGLTSDEHQFAQRYFFGYEGAFKIPETLWITGEKENPQPAVLQSASVRSLTLEDIKVSGQLSITVNGEQHDVSVDLTSATSF